MTFQYARLKHLFSAYDAFLIDQFGVLMSGDGPYQGAAEALKYVTQLGKPSIILSNSGKRSELNCARLVHNGFDRSDFLTVLTSGEVAHEYISQQIGLTIPDAGKVLALIREGDEPPLSNLNLEVTKDPAAADFLMIISRDPACTLSSYKPTLELLVSRAVPCFCLNPDMEMLTPTGTIASAGQIGKIYSDLGGSVQWFGKPHSLIYQKALQLLPSIEAKRVLCLGDSLSHDILGGSTAGCKTALVRTGIHAALSDEELEKFATTLSAQPDHVLKGFSL
ncbi:MAG: TIGR01459 family HAD-type hydrolase [Roseobacter sp.]